MFDEKPIQQNPVISQPSDQQANPPKNLPIGSPVSPPGSPPQANKFGQASVPAPAEVKLPEIVPAPAPEPVSSPSATADDKLPEIAQKADSTASPDAEPLDILEGLDKDEAEAESEAVKGPAMPIAPPPRPAGEVKTPMPPAMAPPEKPITKEPFFKAHKKAFVIFIVLLLGGSVLGFGGYYGYSLLVDSKPARVNQPATPINQPSTNINQAVNTNQGAVNQNSNVNQAITQPIDTDRDGLSDEDEAKYGTSPTEVDSDKDGLTDRDEIKVFGTDPNNPDSDGDGFLDGEEVRAGYDPKGPGRLLRIEP